MSYDKCPQYWAYRNTIKFLLLIVGLWPSNNPSQSSRLLSYTALFASTITVFGIIGYVRLNFTNIAVITKSISFMISYLAVILKDAYELHRILDSHFTKLLINQPVSSFILNDLRIIRYLAWLFTFATAFVCFHTVLDFNTSIIHQHRQNEYPINYSLIYPAVYPWSIDPPGLRYKIHLLIQLVAIVPLLCVTSGIDSLFTMYCFQMVGHFREMSYRITHIDRITDDKHVIRECVLQHYAMMRCRDILQKIYGPVILWVMTTNSIILCSLMFQFTQMKSIPIPKIISFSMYITLKMIQTFMYTWTGTCITTESENYRKAIYASDWLRNKYFMSSVLMMLSQKPMVLIVYNFMGVSLDIFSAVLNTTISYYFLLQTLQ